MTMTVEEAMAITIDEALGRIQDLEDQVAYLEEQLKEQVAACKAATTALGDALYQTDVARDYMRAAVAKLR